MEAFDGKVEFLCLGCGLQGLVQWPPLDDAEVFCPKCGERVITSLLLKKEKIEYLTL
ncbi:MAG: hypothetical protein GX357_07625 [Firmicutes bacterium]|nr:hypothetical protein [Bacillota bacterium]